MDATFVPQVLLTEERKSGQTYNDWLPEISCVFWTIQINWTIDDSPRNQLRLVQTIWAIEIDNKRREPMIHIQCYSSSCLGEHDTNQGTKISNRS